MKAYKFSTHTPRVVIFIGCVKRTNWLVRFTHPTVKNTTQPQALPYARARLSACARLFGTSRHIGRKLHRETSSIPGREILPFLAPMEPNADGWPSIGISALNMSEKRTDNANNILFKFFQKSPLLLGEGSGEGKIISRSQRSGVRTQVCHCLLASSAVCSSARPVSRGCLRQKGQSHFC
jgi:hypothetical protein